MNPAQLILAANIKKNPQTNSYTNGEESCDTLENITAMKFYFIAVFIMETFSFT